MSDQAAGIYNVAFTIMAAVYLLPDVIYQKYLLPKFHRWANYDRARFLEVYQAGNGAMLLLGVFVSGAILILAPWVIPLLFGKVYQEAVSVLTILALCVPLHFLAISIGVTLVTQEHMRLKVYYMGVVAVINVLLNILIIPLYGAQGAALSTLLCEITLLILYLLAVRKHVFGSDAWRGWSLSPTILMGKIKS
ncbi:polysaccharide biosynthesis C-terminal domain-containing protein [Candidatus Thioglobus sp.]|nr:polysaccharide biosynthesis C-terminal domain-containing protein [Candidatus Thioglobus sp.]